MSDLPHALSATIQSIDRENAVLLTKDGQTIRWPVRLLKPESTPGTAVHLLVLSDTDASDERERLAKQVLNEMLKGV